MQNNLIKEFFDNKAEFWDSFEKKDNKFFNDFVRENIAINKNDTILDLACGTGVITNVLASYTINDVIGIDISENMIKKANEKEKSANVKFVNIDFYDLDGLKFDLIVCHNAYPHFLDKEKFKNKCFNLLSKNGRLIICHSISRNEVNKCHNDKTNISVSLNEVTEEFKVFEDKFSLIRLYEDENIYFLEVRKN